MRWKQVNISYLNILTWRIDRKNRELEWICSSDSIDFSIFVTDLKVSSLQFRLFGKTVSEDESYKLVGEIYISLNKIYSNRKNGGESGDQIMIDQNLWSNGKTRGMI